MKHERDEIMQKGPVPPYYAVIFSSTMSSNKEGYAVMSNKMVELASKEEGYLGIESARDEHGFGITISYWESEEAIMNWKKNSFHLLAQDRGKSRWYDEYTVRICKVEKEYSM